MHLFKAFTFAVIVIWCQVEGTHSKSKNKSIHHKHSSNKETSFTEFVETSTISSSPYTAKTKKPKNKPLSNGTQSPSSTIFKSTSSEIVDNNVKSDEVSSEKSKLNTGATSQTNATEPAPVFPPRMKHRLARFRTNRTRNGNSTIRRQRLHRNGFGVRFRTLDNGTRVRLLRKGFGPHFRTMENVTRVRLHRKLRERRGENVTFRMRAQRIKKRRKQRTTITNKPGRGTALYDTTNTTQSDNEDKKKRKHITSSIKNFTHDGSIFSDTESLKDTALSESSNAATELKKEKKHHASNIKKLQDGSGLAAAHIKDLAFSDPEGKKDTSLSDTEHINLLKHHKTSTQESLRDTYASSDTESNKDISDTEPKKDIYGSGNEHKELLKHDALIEKKILRDKSVFYDTGSKSDDFSSNESKVRVKMPQKKQPYQWPKTKSKKAERQGKKAERQGKKPERQFTKHGRKPNQYIHRHGTETTTRTKEYKKTTKADLGKTFKPYTIKAHLNALKRKFNDVNITNEVIGRTMSYYDIVMMKVSAKRHSYDNEIYFRARENRFADDGPEKRIVFIVHGLSVMGIHDLPCLLEVKEFEKLLSYYFAHLDKFDIFLIPMANPDGVAVPTEIYRSYINYDRSNWNKNTSPQSECPGVALDRNFDVAWNIRRNLSSCNQQYPGPYPFSEHETKAIRDVLHRYSQRIVAYLNVHAGTYTSDIFKGDAVLYPRGYTDVQTDDDRYIDLRGEIDEVLKNASFQVYTVHVDTLYNWYGKVGGTSVDYAASVYGIPYSMELVMQLYTETHRSKEEEQEQNAVLRTSWRRVIDVIFNSVLRYGNATGV